jgi:hypothetical protein
MFFYMIISCTCELHPRARNSKLNEHKQLAKWQKKRSFPSIVLLGVSIEIGFKNHVE